MSRVHLLVVLLLASPPVLALDGWLGTETRIYPWGRFEGEPAFALRGMSDLRFEQAAGGLNTGFFRLGPLVDVNDWFFVAVHAFIGARRTADGEFVPEYRIEWEPNFHGRLGAFTWNNRHRLENRWVQGRNLNRYRNQIRVNFAPPGARWRPFVMEEVFFDLGEEGFNQNRVHVGIARMVGNDLRIDLAYMWRAIADPLATPGGAPISATWKHQHVIVLQFVHVPPVLRRP